jgi:iron(III) transport system substrate-binding protein
LENEVIHLQGRQAIRNHLRRAGCALAFLWTTIAGAACLTGPSADLTVYSGRSQELMEPLIERFRRETGLKVQVRYGGTPELAATILEEGKNSPADLFLAQDAGALGALAREDRLRRLPTGLLEALEPRYRSPEGFWTGISGRARVVAYNTNRLNERELPDSIREFTDPRWRGRIGWAPSNGSFQAFVTGLRLVWGEEETLSWLRGIVATSPKAYPNNTSLVEAVGRGEIDVGFTNHYYLFRFLAESGESFPVRNYYARAGGIESLVNVSGAGILDTCRNQATSEKFIAFLLSGESQEYFGRVTREYPLGPGVDTPPLLPELSTLDDPGLDLSRLDDLQGSIRLLQRAGAL